MFIQRSPHHEKHSFTVFFLLIWEQVLAQEVTPRHQPGANMTLYTPEQHQHYDGHFILSARRHTDPAGWDHIGNDASNVHPVEGTVDIDVNEIKNTGHFVARLKVPEGDLILELNQFQEFSPCQDGGLAAYRYEHSVAGCGDVGGQRSMQNRCTRIRKCTSWSPRAFATETRCKSNIHPQTSRRRPGRSIPRPCS